MGCFDRVAEWLQSQGMVDYLVEIGGEIRVSGINPHGQPWRIAVEKPDSFQRDVMAAVSLLETNAKPSEAEIREHLQGNICRCTGYHNIVKAIMAASGQEVPAVAAE